jgi:acyl-CoA synthetase (AMP-forming)/AMP-acid ligase II
MQSVARDSPLYEELDGSGLVLFSSGTSGEPKGMLHRFGALLDPYRQLQPRQDRTLLLLLIDHIGGLDSAFRCLFAGSTLVVPGARTPEAAGAAIEQHQVNVLPASPTFLNLILLSRIHKKYDLRSLEIIAYGAEAMPEPLLRRLGDIFPQAQRQQKFGTSETGAIRIKSVEADSLYFRIDDRESEWKVIDSELWLKTPSRIIGYINSDNNSLESDGWYRTGDLVESDGQGNIRIIGRMNETINVGGQKVHPDEVARVLQLIPDVEAVHVYGENDPITGSRVCAKIFTLSADSPLAWKRKVRSHCRTQLSAWKIPSRIVLCSEIDVTNRLKQATS